MITLGMMQFTAVVLMLLLTLKLLVLHDRYMKDRAMKRSRWLMVVGSVTLALHFALQLKMGLRLMGVTQSVMLNLVMLIPASYMFALAILILQRRGRLSLWDVAAGPLTWVVVMVILCVAAFNDGVPLLDHSPMLHKAEVAGAILYLMMQAYYSCRHTINIMAMRRALHDYYDRDVDGILRWMQLSIVGLTLLALMVPFAIFDNGQWLMAIAFAIYFFIFYLVDSFCSYLTSSAPARMQEAEQNADEMEQGWLTEEADEEPSEESALAAIDDEKMLMSSEAIRAIDEAVEKWIERGGHLRLELKLPLAAEDIGIRKHRLTCWLHQKGKKYTEWISELRIEEAKRLIKAHPDWTNETIAQHCGYTDRSFFRTFKKLTGMTPMQFAEQESSKSNYNSR